MTTKCNCSSKTISDPRAHAMDCPVRSACASHCPIAPSAFPQWGLCTPADPADELGKVWDVLHAAGINSGGELSASEGVKLLAGRFTGELMDEYQALQERFDELHLKLVDAQLLNNDAMTLINQFLPNAGKCFGIDVELLNETMIASRKL